MPSKILLPTVLVVLSLLHNIKAEDWKLGLQFRDDEMGGKIIDMDVNVDETSANIGWYSLAVASQGFSVIAVEPARYNNELFKASIEINGHLDVKLHEVVVTDKVEENSCLRLAPYVVFERVKCENRSIFTLFFSCFNYVTQSITISPQEKSMLFEFTLDDDELQVRKSKRQSSKLSSHDIL